MCEHLIPLENELKSRGIKETYRGQAWSNNCREWAYYDCYFDVGHLRERFHFPEFVKHHFNDDPRSGLEEGLVCMQCYDAVVGLNSRFELDSNKVVFK